MFLQAMRGDDWDAWDGRNNPAYEPHELRTCRFPLIARRFARRCSLSRCWDDLNVSPGHARRRLGRLGTAGVIRPTSRASYEPVGSLSSRGASRGAALFPAVGIY